MKTKATIVLVISLLFTINSFAQRDLSIPEIEIIDKLFTTQHVVVLDYQQENGWGDLPEDYIESFSEVANSIKQNLSNHRTFDTTLFLEDYGDYNAFVEEIFKYESDPGNYNSMIGGPFFSPIYSISLKLLDENLGEYFRKFEIRYGGLSEKLNLLEAFLNKAFFSPETTGSELNYPKPLEPILRIQSVGYQYNTDSQQMLPSSPVFQAGLSYYFLQQDGLFRSIGDKIHHIGIAGALQYDLFTETWLTGGVMHIRNFDIGLLYNADQKQTVVMASFNVQLIKGLF
jgi:hypothetical protein